MKRQRCVVAYSGSAAATTALKSLVADRADVATLTVDLGQPIDLGQVRDAALAAGATRAHVIDARDEFVREHLLPALRAGVADGGWLPLVRTLGRTLVASKLREVAAIEDAAAVDAAAECDASLAGRLVAAGGYTLTKSADAAPDRPANVEIAFERGVPVSINGVSMALTELMESLATIGGQHAVGRMEAVEAPAAVLLHAALHAEHDGRARLTLRKGTVAEQKELVTQS